MYWGATSTPTLPEKKRLWPCSRARGWVRWPAGVRRSARAIPEVQILEYPFSKLDRARTDGTDEGFVKLIFSSSRLNPRLLGATVVGPRAAELLYTLEQMYASRIHPLKLASPTPAYPSYAEGLRYAVMGLFSASEMFGSRR
jgi:hypothetical protein